MGDGSEGLEERVQALEARLSELEERVVAHTLESIWAHLQAEGLAGFPARIVDEIAAKVVEIARAQMNLETLANRLVVSATRPLMQAIDQRLDQIQASRSAADPAAEERLIRIEQRLERLEVNSDDDATRPIELLAREVQALRARIEPHKTAGA